MSKPLLTKDTVSKKSFCLICEKFLGKLLFFITLNVCRDIDHNSTKKYSLYKRRHSLSINRLLYHIKTHCKPIRSQDLLCEEALSISLEPRMEPRMYNSNNCSYTFLHHVNKINSLWRKMSSNVLYDLIIIILSFL